MSHVDTVYIDKAIFKKASGNGTYKRVLLRTSFRQDGKVKHRTLGNLSDCSEEEINAIKLALKHKGDLPMILQQAQNQSGKPLGPPQPAPTALPLEADPSLPRMVQGPSVGAILTLKQIAEETGVAQALGHDRDGMLALWQVIARAMDQGSRLSAVRLARDLQAQASLPGLPNFDEDDLYPNLTWLTERQQDIENAVFAFRQKTDDQGGEISTCLTLPDNMPAVNPAVSPVANAANASSSKGKLYLYDVTSTYLEGQENELAEYGYNRDGKRGKKQIVAGLLCCEDGLPVSI